MLLIFVCREFAKIKGKVKKKIVSSKKWIRKRKQKDEAFSLQGIFIFVFFLVLCTLSITFMVNAFYKIVPIGQTKTEATITSKYSQREWLAFRTDTDHMIDPLFQFELIYTDQNGKEHRVVKEVTSYTYYKYDVNDTIPISYRNANPLDIFIRKMSLFDFLSLFKYAKFYLYIAGSIATIIFGRSAIRSILRFLKNKKIKFAK